MIKSRIIDNDMGKVMKVPLTGRGTIHGITVEIDVVVGQEKDDKGRPVDIIKRVVVPELDISLLEMINGDGGLERFKAHAMAHLEDPQLVQKFTDSYRSWIEPILKSGKNRY